MAVKKVNIVFETDTRYSDIFWDEDGCEIGDFNTIYLENKEAQVSDLEFKPFEHTL